MNPVRLQRGFALASGIFLLVMLAVLGAYLLTLSSSQQVGAALDVQGSRALQAARAGVEWGAWRVLRPAVAPACPASPSSFGLANTLAGFTVTVQCARSQDEEAGVAVNVYRFVSTACTQPAAGACPPAIPGAGYVERQITTVVSR